MAFNLYRKPTELDSLIGYDVMGKLIPKFYQTKFPYDLWDKGKLTFTKNKIDILVKKEEKLKKLVKKGEKLEKLVKKEENVKKKTKGGSESTPSIIIYG